MPAKKMIFAVGLGSVSGYTKLKPQAQCAKDVEMVTPDDEVNAITLDAVVRQGEYVVDCRSHALNDDAFLDYDCQQEAYLIEVERKIFEDHVPDVEIVSDRSCESPTSDASSGLDDTPTTNVPNGSALHLPSSHTLIDGMLLCFGIGSLAANLVYDNIRGMADDDYDTPRVYLEQFKKHRDDRNMLTPCEMYEKYKHTLFCNEVLCDDYMCPLKHPHPDERVNRYEAYQQASAFIFDKRLLAVLAQEPMISREEFINELENDLARRTTLQIHKSEILSRDRGVAKRVNTSNPRFGIVRDQNGNVDFTTYNKYSDADDHYEDDFDFGITSPPRMLERPVSSPLCRIESLDDQVGGVAFRVSGDFLATAYHVAKPLVQEGKWFTVTSTSFAVAVTGVYETCDPNADTCTIDIIEWRPLWSSDQSHKKSYSKADLFSMLSVPSFKMSEDEPSSVAFLRDDPAHIPVERVGAFHFAAPIYKEYLPVPGESGTPIMNDQGRIVGVFVGMYKTGMLFGRFLGETEMLARLLRHGVRDVRLYGKRKQPKKVNGDTTITFSAGAEQRAFIAAAERDHANVIYNQRQYDVDQDDEGFSVHDYSESEDSDYDDALGMSVSAYMGGTKKNAKKPKGPLMFNPRGKPSYYEYSGPPPPVTRSMTIDELTAEMDRITGTMSRYMPPPALPANVVEAALLELDPPPVSTQTPHLELTHSGGQLLVNPPTQTVSPPGLDVQPRPPGITQEEWTSILTLRAKNAPKQKVKQVVEEAVNPPGSRAAKALANKIAELARLDAELAKYEKEGVRLNEVVVLSQEEMAGDKINVDLRLKTKTVAALKLKKSWTAQLAERQRVRQNEAARAQKALARTTSEVARLSMRLKEHGLDQDF